MLRSLIHRLLGCVFVVWLLGAFVVGCQIALWSCSSTKSREAMAKAQETCAEINQRYIAQGACERCRITKLPDGEVHYYVDSSECKTLKPSDFEKAIEGRK
jgi:hypothetical protein